MSSNGKVDAVAPANGSSVAAASVASAATPPPPPSFWRRAALLVACSLGIYATFLGYGLIQERMSVTRTRSMLRRRSSDEEAQVTVGPQR
jgi:hypothetical protein